jgi:RNA polymerase sigma-70 factor (ECF subfamily)
MPGSTDLRSLADEDLMQLVQRGDARAFELVYDRHSGAAFSLAYRMVGRGNVAEDVVQEAFLSIWRSGARYDPLRGSVRNWVFGVVRNRAIDALRRGSAKRTPKLAMDGGELIEKQPSADQTEAEAIRRETAKEVRSRLDELPGEQSQVIELAYFGGFTHSEIAEMLQMPIGTVKGRMRLGLEKIRAGLAEEML